MGIGYASNALAKEGLWLLSLERGRGTVRKRLLTDTYDLYHYTSIDNLMSTYLHLSFIMVLHTTNLNHVQ